MNAPLRINLWSGPRNVSTALMYAFAQRGDTTVVDEPLYGHYLRVSHAPHPGADEVMAHMRTDAQQVIDEVILGPAPHPVLFMKQMAHHLVELDRTFLGRTANVLLIRDPEEMLPSLAENLAVPTLRDTGLATQAALYDELVGLGQDPPVLDARQLLLDPRGVLTKLCDRLGIPFDAHMLAWPPGPRPEDGIWAKHWYQAVHRTTGFLPYTPKAVDFPDRLRPLLDDCRPYYTHLAQRALMAAGEITEHPRHG